MHAGFELSPCIKEEAFHANSQRCRPPPHYVFIRVIDLSGRAALSTVLPLDRAI